MSTRFRRRALFGAGILLIALFAAACSLDTSGPSNMRAYGALGGGPSAPSLNAAGDFAVLGSAVTLTDSVVTGDVGTLGAYTNTRSTVIGNVHEADLVAQQAYDDFLVAYDAFAAIPTDPTHLLTGTLAGVTLAPGVYYFEAAATVTGVLTLDAQNDPNAQWIFKIGTLGTGALTGTGFSVVMINGGTPCSVYWWVAEAATMTASNFQGTILAGMAITATGGTFNGDALAKADVTLTGTELAGCGTGVSITPNPAKPPIYGSVKVTGGGQIAIDGGMASFGFNAQPDKSAGGSKGNFNYVNHVTGLHTNGKVDSIVVIEINADGSPKTVVFSGTYAGGSFVVTVQDQGEPGTSDQFGVLLIGSQPEVESLRVISNGNIQFHK